MNFSVCGKILRSFQNKKRKKPAMVRYLFPGFLVLFTCLIIFSGCVNTTDPSDDEPAIYGRVTDKNGLPLAGVNVHYIPELFDSSFGKVIQDPNIGVRIYFSITEESYVRLILTEHLTGDTINILVDDTLSAGSYYISVDARPLTNGIYNYILKINDQETTRILFIIKATEDLVTSEPLTVTDNNGNFKLLYKRLGIGDVLQMTSESSPDPIGYQIISNKLDLFFTKPGYYNLQESIIIDTNKTFRKTFVIKY
jgi:hypothetical protein